MTTIQEGRLEMVGILFERYHARMHGLCTQMVRDASLADDLVQESFVRVLRYRNTFSEPHSFGAWLYRIARNVCLDNLKARDRESEALERMYSMEPEPDTAQMWNAENAERLDALRDALGRLTEEERSVLVLKRVHGLSYRDIAERCGSTEGAMRVRAHRALRRLRELVGVTRTGGVGHEV